MVCINGSGQFRDQHQMSNVMVMVCIGLYTLVGDSHGLTTLFVSMVSVSSEIGIRCRMSWSWSEYTSTSMDVRLRVGNQSRMTLVISRNPT